MVYNVYVITVETSEGKKVNFDAIWRRTHWYAIENNGKLTLVALDVLSFRPRYGRVFEVENEKV